MCVSHIWKQFFSKLYLENIITLWTNNQFFFNFKILFHKMEKTFLDKTQKKKNISPSLNYKDHWFTYLVTTKPCVNNFWMTLFPSIVGPTCGFPIIHDAPLGLCDLPIVCRLLGCLFELPFCFHVILHCCCTGFIGQAKYHDKKVVYPMGQKDEP